MGGWGKRKDIAKRKMRVGTKDIRLPPAEDTCETGKEDAMDVGGWWKRKQVVRCRGR